MKRFVCIALILALAVAAVLSCGSVNRSARAGGPSGKIVIYTSMYRGIIEIMDEVLEREFPDCDIEFVYGGTGQIQAKIAAEQKSKRLGCDMLMVAEPAYSLELKEKGILHPYISPEADFLAFDYDEDGYWYPVRISNMVLAYNPEKYAKDSIPNSFYDFAFDASVMGAISMSNPLTSGTALASATALRDKYGYEYFEALGRQKIEIESGAVALERLERGRYKVIMVLEESVLMKRQEEHSKLEVIYPVDGTIIIPSTIMTIANRWSANRNIMAAEMITDWFLSPEGQDVIVGGWMHSVRNDSLKIPYDAIPISDIQGNSTPVNWENYFRQREEIQARFEDYITNRR